MCIRSVERLGLARQCVLCCAVLCCAVYTEEMDEAGEGGAVMVSAVVRAPPADVFKVGRHGKAARSSAGEGWLGARSLQEGWGRGERARVAVMQLTASSEWWVCTVAMRSGPTFGEYTSVLAVFVGRVATGYG